MTMTAHEHLARARPAGERRTLCDCSDQRRIATLIKHAAQGDQRSWDTIVHAFSPMLWAIARAHRLDDADACDVVQSTWIKLLDRLGDLHRPSSVGAWLATTARRECLRLLRDATRYAPLTDEAEDESGEPLPGDELVEAERSGALWRGFTRLRGSDQALLRLLIADPAPSYEAIAATLSMPVGSIGPTRARALERLRRELDAEGTLELCSPL